jgi:hypothetical protein
MTAKKSKLIRFNLAHKVIISNRIVDLGKQRKSDGKRRLDRRQNNWSSIARGNGHASSFESPRQQRRDSASLLRDQSGQYFASRLCKSLPNLLEEPLRLNNLPDTSHLSGVFNKVACGLSPGLCQLIGWEWLWHLRVPCNYALSISDVDYWISCDRRNLSASLSTILL